MTQEYKYSLTRVCLRRGEMSLSRSLASLFEDAGDRVEDYPGPTDPLPASGGESEVSALCVGACFSPDDRLTSRRRLPRLASPDATHEVETSHPLGNPRRL